MLAASVEHSLQNVYALRAQAGITEVEPEPELFESIAQSAEVLTGWLMKRSGGKEVRSFAYNNASFKFKRPQFLASTVVGALGTGRTACTRMYRVASSVTSMRALFAQPTIVRLFAGAKKEKPWAKRQQVSLRAAARITCRCHVAADCGCRD